MISTIKMIVFTLLVLPIAVAQDFSCPAGQADVMKYFAMDQHKRANRYMDGRPNPIYTEVFPDQDFNSEGYWFWLKSPKAHGFDVKAFDQQQVYMRSTELNWKDNHTFKRFVHDLPISARCVSEGKPGPEIKVPDTTFEYFASCRPYKRSNVGTAVNNLDAPIEMNAGGNMGKVWTRVLHYHYNCDRDFKNCRDEEQFFLANSYGLWQWKHFAKGSLVKTALMNDLEKSKAAEDPPCPESYRK